MKKKIGIIVVGALLFCFLIAWALTAIISSAAHPDLGANPPPTPPAASTTAAPSTGAEPGVDTYLCTWSAAWSPEEAAAMFQWRDDNGTIAGTMNYAYEYGQPSPGVDTGTATIQGTQSGSGLTLDMEGTILYYTPTISAPGGSVTVYGTASDSEVTLNFPQQDGTLQAATCPAATVADWNNAVQEMGSQ